MTKEELETLNKELTAERDLLKESVEKLTAERDSLTVRVEEISSRWKADLEEAQEAFIKLKQYHKAQLDGSPAKPARPEDTSELVTVKCGSKRPVNIGGKILQPGETGEMSRRQAEANASFVTITGTVEAAGGDEEPQEETE